MGNKELKKTLEAAIADWNARKPADAKGQWKQTQDIANGYLYLVWEIPTSEWENPEDGDLPWAEWGGNYILESMPGYVYFDLRLSMRKGQSITSQVVTWELDEEDGDE